MRVVVVGGGRVGRGMGISEGNGGGGYRMVNLGRSCDGWSMSIKGMSG